MKTKPNFEKDRSVEFVKETASARNDSFNRRLRKEPSNVDLWIEFINFQDQLPSSSTRSLLERKTAIVERALEHNPTSLLLIKTHLNLISRFMSFAEILKTWDRHLALLEKRKDMSFWPLVFEYLNFRMNHFSCFNVEQILCVFAEFFKKDSDGEMKRELLLLLVTFLHRTGHYEKMIALLQATIEVNLEILNYGDIDLDAYADQWDSGLMQHVGELDLNDVKPTIGPTLFGSWITVETTREITQFYPLADDDVDDLDRNVLFHDISDFLCRFEKEDILDVLKGILGEFSANVGAHSAINILSNFRKQLDSIFDSFFKNLYCTILPYYKDDWEVICSWMLFNRDQVKQTLAENKQSIPHFIAYGVYCIITGDVQQAEKVLKVTFAKPSPYKEQIQQAMDLVNKQATVPLAKWQSELVAADLTNRMNDEKKRLVYELLQKYPADKKLYMEIISSLANVDEGLCREIYNLMNEQQVRVRCLIEEVEYLRKQ